MVGQVFPSAAGAPEQVGTLPPFQTQGGLAAEALWGCLIGSTTRGHGWSFWARMGGLVLRVELGESESLAPGGLLTLQAEINTQS